MNSSVFLQKCSLCKKEVPVEEWVDFLDYCLECNQRLSAGIDDVIKGNVLSTKEAKANRSEVKDE